jgi:hypothetical protein
MFTTVVQKTSMADLETIPTVAKRPVDESDRRYEVSSG